MKQIWNWSVNITKSWLLLCAIDAFSKYSWVLPLKDKKHITISKPNCTNKLCQNKCSKFYNRWIDEWSYGYKAMI